MQNGHMYMEILQLAGRIIMENGGETFRAEETVSLMGQALGLEDVEGFAVPSGLFISFRWEEESVSSVLRVRRGGTDLSRVDAVNEISRELVQGRIDAGHALKALERIRKEAPRHRKLMSVLGSGICAAGFSLMFGNNELPYNDNMTRFIRALIQREIELPWTAGFSEEDVSRGAKLIEYLACLGPDVEELGTEITPEPRNFPLFKRKE